MPYTLDAGDRKLLIGAGVLLVVLVIVSALLAPSRQDSNYAYPSSYSTGWEGGKAAYLLLQELGYHARRWEESPTELKSREDVQQVLIFAEPARAATPEEKESIREFLEKGGQILAAGAGAAQLLPESSPLVEGYPFGEKTTFHPLLPSPLIRNAPEITMIAPDHWEPPSASQLVVYGTERTAAVITYSVGKGRIVWWGASTPLTNAGIRESGNLALFLNSLGPPARVEVLWDEYFHGARRSLWTYVKRTPLLWGVAQLGLVFLAILATHSRRQGPIHTPMASSRLSPLEFVETLGDLYSSAHAGSTAVRIAYQRLRYQLVRQLGLAGNVSDSDLANRANTALGWDEKQFSGTLARAQQFMDNPKLKDQATLEMVREILEYTSRLELRRGRAAERPNG